MKMLKNFIPLGSKGFYLNINYIDLEHSYIDTKIKKAIIIDKHGVRYVVDPKLLKGRLELPMREGGKKNG